MNTIVITGGTGRFGRALVRHFLDKGQHQVVFTSRSQQKIDELLAETGSNSSRVVGVKIDLCERESGRALAAKLEAEGFRVASLVNNARSLDSLAVGPEGVTARESFLDEFLLDVVVPYELTMALANTPGSALKSVVNIGSQYGVVAPTPALYSDFANQSPVQYGVCKAAVMQLTKELAVRLADKGIRVNCAAFGGVEGRVDPEFLSRYAKLTPMKRMLQVEEVAGPVDFLVSDSSSSMTGHTIVADGGWTAW